MLRGRCFHALQWKLHRPPETCWGITLIREQPSRKKSWMLLGPTKKCPTSLVTKPARWKIASFLSNNKCPLLFTFVSWLTKISVCSSGCLHWGVFFNRVDFWWAPILGGIEVWPGEKAGRLSCLLVSHRSPVTACHHYWNIACLLQCVRVCRCKPSLVWSLVCCAVKAFNQ